MITPRRARLLSVPLVALVALAACGDDESGSGSTEEWCSLTDEADVISGVFDNFEDTATDPAAIETAMTEVEDFLGEVRAAAPSEIADDVDTLADGTQMLVDALAEANYNLLDADLSFLGDDALGDEMDAAGDRIDEYSLEECGRVFGEADTGSDADDPESGDSDTSESDDSDFAPEDGSIREQLAEQFESLGMTSEEATCVAEGVDPALADDPNSLLAIMGECGISLERIAELGG